ncbi:MAG: extracellular solute-binding protein [Spirochaetales bacterium]|nr:extracellular solute-binding protein [Spirochaetales bacterium]
MKTNRTLASAMVLALLLPAALMASGSSELENAGDEQITLSVVHWVSEDSKRAGFEAIQELFTERHPNVTFETQSIPFGQYEPNLKLRIAGGDMPDIVFGKPVQWPELVRAGHFMDLTGESALDNLDPVVLAGSSVIDGRVYGVPFDATYMGLFYHKDMLEEYDLPVPMIYSELLQASEVFMDNGIYPFAHAFQNANQPSVEIMSTGFNQVLYATDTMDFATRVRSGDLQMATVPEFRTYFERMAELMSFSYGDEMGSDNPRARRQFATGERPFMIQGTWAVGDYRTMNPDGDFGFLAFPWSDDVSENTVPVFADDSFMGSASSDHPELVREFLLLLASEEAARIWFEKTSLIPVYQGIELETIDPMLLDAQALAAEGRTIAGPPGLTGEYGQRSRELVQMFVAESSVDVDAWMAEFDATMGAIE